jgi:hypothetical protein
MPDFHRVPGTICGDPSLAGRSRGELRGPCRRISSAGWRMFSLGARGTLRCRPGSLAGNGAILAQAVGPRQRAGRDARCRARSQIRRERKQAAGSGYVEIKRSARRPTAGAGRSAPQSPTGADRIGVAVQTPPSEPPIGTRNAFSRTAWWPPGTIFPSPSHTEPPPSRLIR